jgi:hypothetical protein
MIHPLGLWDRFYVARDPLKPSIVDRVLSSESNPTVARSSEAVRADGYEHRSTVYLLLASIAANLEWRFIPVTCKRVADPFYGWRNSSVTP